MARPSAQEQAQILERQLKAIDLRKRGLTYREIGRQLDVSHVQAYKDVNAELRRLTKLRDKKADQERQLDLERIDAMIKGLEPMAAVGNPGAVNSLLKCLERRSKLLGLDMPTETKNDHTSNGQTISVTFNPVPARDKPPD